MGIFISNSSEICNIHTVILPHLAHMNGIILSQIFTSRFDITEEEIVIFENMNEAFNQYVYGGKNGYNASLIAYKKEVYDVKKLLPEENLFLQVFLNDGTNYLEDKAITNHIIGQNVKLNIPIEFTQDVSEIRLDPLNGKIMSERSKLHLESGKQGCRTIRYSVHLVS